MADPLIKAGNNAAQAVAPTLTPDQQSLSDNQNISAGQAGSPWSTSSTVMTPSQAFNNTPINNGVVPTVNSPNTSGAIVAGAQQTVDQVAASLTPAPTALDNQQQGLLNDISTLTGQDAGKDQALLDEDNANGATADQAALTSANNELNTKIASYNQLEANVGSGIGGLQASAAYNAQLAGLKTAAAADVGVTQAKITAAQGNLTLALNQAQAAVNARYSTIEDNIKTKQAQLDALAPKLNAQQQTQALAQQKVLADQAQKVADEKAAATSNVQLALTAGVNTKYVNNNGQFFDATTGQPFSDPADFFAAAGVTSFEDAYQKGLITDITPAKLQDAQFALQAQAKYSDVKITPQMTHDEVVKAIQGSKIYQKDTYIAPTTASLTAGGISPELASMINAGKVDPNLINSRTLPIYESIARASVDAVGAHAGASGETQAVTDLVNQKAIATKTLGVIDANLPLVAGLADKVNQTGIPGLDSYLSGIKVYTGNDQDVVKYINSIKTLRSEYAQMLAKGNAATESDKNEAASAIPSGLSGDAYNALGQQLKLEGQNIIDVTDQAIADAKNSPSSNVNTSNSIPNGTDGSSYGFPGYVSDGTQWVPK